jgi:hypothetical protein
MPYEEFKNIVEYVKNKVSLLKGNSLDNRDPFRHFVVTPRGGDHKEKAVDLSLDNIKRGPLETYNLDDVFDLKEIKQLGHFKMSILKEGLKFLWDISVNLVNGHRVGAILVIGGIKQLEEHSTGEIPNPLKGHSRAARSIFKSTFRNSLAQFSLFDGFMGMDWDGCVEFCGRLIEVPGELGTGPKETWGHGARHKAGWAISKLVPESVSLVLSQDGEILVIINGKVLKKIICMDLDEHIVAEYFHSLDKYVEDDLSLGEEGLSYSNHDHSFTEKEGG